MQPANFAESRAGRGFSLIELMIAMTLALLLAAASLSLYAHTRTAGRAAEAVAALEERALFALSLLEEDLRLAGYWGLQTDGAAVGADPGIQIHCNSTNVNFWALRLADSVEAYDNSYGVPCPALGAPALGSDALIVRHAGGAATTPEAGRVQLHSSFVAGQLFNDGSPPLLPSLPVHDLELHAWYVDTRSSESGLPALRRFALVKNGLLQNQEIMPGVEDLQVQLALDTDGDALIDGFFDPGTATGTVLAARITLTVRSALREPGVPDGYRRLQASRIVFVRNNAASS